MSVSKIMNSDLTASWKPNPKCSVCYNEFSVASQSRKRPMILSCYHNICEECVFMYGGCKPYIQCRICNVKTAVIKSQVYRQYLELNYYLNGFLYYKAHILNFDISKSTSYTNNNNDNSTNNQRHECNECNQEYTNNFCIQCRLPYCMLCFKRVHKTGKAFAKHTLSLLNNDNNTIFNNLKENKKCKIHKQILNKYCQTCNAFICGNCSTGIHNTHSITPAQNENKKYLEQINSLIETVKMAKESNRRALSDSKLVERKYDQHCDEAITHVTSYYQKLHSILQLSETKILMKIKENVLNSIGKIKQTQSTLEKTLTSTDGVINFLQKIVDERPNYPLLDIIDRTNHFLETTPCQVKFENFQNSPFSISETNISELDLENCLHVKCGKPEDAVNVNILTFFGDVSNDNTIENFEPSENSSNQQKLLMSLQIDDIPIKKNNKKLKKNLSIDVKKSSNPNILYTQRVHVSHIKNPLEFYVQNEYFRLQLWDDFHLTCKIEGESAETPDYIEINHIYLIYSNNTWYRGRIIKIMKNSNNYKVFLIDFGISMQVAKQCIRQISDDIQNKPKHATKCALVGIKIKNDNNDEANIIMSDIIAKNELIDMVVLKEAEDTWIVDLITTNNFPTSISDVLIFTDVSEKSDIDINEKELNRNWRVYIEMKKKLIPTIKKNFYKTLLTEAVNSRIVALHIKDPQEFYITKYDLKSELEKLSDELNQINYKNNMKIYLPRINMPCAACINGKWYRARILEVESKLRCKVWLVDYGISEIIVWKQLRVLDEIFFKNNEYSFQCSLMDIEPLQCNNYEWTSEAITEFKHFMKRPNLQIFVHKTKDFCHKITLFIVKKTVDINVNALMVKLGFAISTGTESLFVDCPKFNSSDNKLLLPKEKLKDNNNIEINKFNQLQVSINSNTSELSNSVSKITQKTITNSNINKKSNQSRKKILITSIKSPGEFYIHLEKHLNSINELQEEIQITQNQKLCDNPESTIKHNWQINENCLVYIKLCNNYKNNDDNILQWYRATITDIDTENDKYTIFLRDNGEKIDNIKIDKISPIDIKFNRLCNTILKCHLACVHPTGGMKNWSHSSIDQLKELIRKFDTISVTIQGIKCNDSLPVVLWGMTNEYADPLGPNICKWVNINKFLVNSGLAHLYEQFDKCKQDLACLDKEFEERENKMNELWLNIVDDISKVADCKNKPQSNVSVEESLLNFSDDSDKLENIGSWLPPNQIEKSLFTAIPTFIDNDGFIYLHDARNEFILDKIKRIINEKVEKYKKNCLTENMNWYIGQPCIAPFHLDKLYYRGEIINIKSNNDIQVCFVDYGNIEDCSPSDLIKNVWLTKIPIQAVKYELDGIVPNTENGKWTRDALDFLHNIIVMKMCSVRVATDSMNDSIKKCTLRCETDNIIDLLLTNKHVIKKSKVCNELLQSESSKTFKKAILKSNTVRQFLSSSEDEDSDDEEDLLVGASKPITDDTIRKDSDYYKKLFEEKELVNLYTSIMSGKELSDEIVLDMDCTFHSEIQQENCQTIGESSSTSEDDEAVINLLPKKCDSDDDDKENILHLDSASLISFNPKDTSTIMSRYDEFDALDEFTPYELPYGVTNFYCGINLIRNATNFYIHPLLTENEKIYREMSQRIQIYAKKSYPLSKILPNETCLAKFTDDNLWYRAVIKSQHTDPDKVVVIFVDYLNIDIVPITNLKKCPAKILKYPMRLMQIRVNGLRPNPRWRSPDIISRLTELLKNRKFYANVMKRSKIPEIQLFVSQSNKNLVLQQLIDERLYFLNAEK